MRRRAAIVIASAIFMVILVAVMEPVVHRMITPSRDESVVVVMKTVGPHMEFWQIVRAGIEVAATEFDVDPVIVGPRWEKDIDRQSRICH